MKPIYEYIMVQKSKSPKQLLGLIIMLCLLKRLANVGCPLLILNVDGSSAVFLIPTDIIVFLKLKPKPITTTPLKLNIVTSLHNLDWISQISR